MYYRRDGTIFDIPRWERIFLDIVILIVFIISEPPILFLKVLGVGFVIIAFAAELGYIWIIKWLDNNETEGKGHE